MTTRGELEKRLAQVAGLARKPSRHGDGFSYFLAGREVVHFHGDERMDVRLTKEVIGERRREGSLDPRLRAGGRYAEWVAVTVKDGRDIARALEVVEDAVRANG